MACIDEKGAVTAVAARVLQAVADEGGATAEDVARLAALPLFRARASLRELASEGLVGADGDRHRVTERGRALLGARAG